MGILYALLVILGSLGVFLFGMKVMSEGVQKLAGERFRAIMAAMTGNRWKGIGTGTLVTALVQSSSASTVMVVSFVNARILTLRESIGVILGANLGTTFTFWIVAFLGIKFSFSAISLPIIGIGLPLLFMRRPKCREAGEVLIGFGLLFEGLRFLRDTLPDIQSHPEWLSFVQNLSEYGFGSVLLFLVFGILLTFILQSSSAAGAVTLLMAAEGWIGYEMAAAIVLGENIGTTITANLAAIGANANAKRAARAHLLINLIGVAWLLVIFYPFCALVDFLMPGEISSATLPQHLALFHTLFNFLNILALVAFVPQIEKLVQRMVRSSALDSEHHLIHISSSSLRTGELELVGAQREMDRMIGLAESMFNGFVDIYTHPEVDMTARVKEVKAQEKEADLLAYELTNYLIRCSAHQLSESSASKVVAFTRAVSELEDLCDGCKKLVDQAARRYRKGRFLSPEAESDIGEYASLVRQFLSFIRTKYSQPITAAHMEIALQLEGAIHKAIKKLRKNSIRRMSAQGEIKAEVLYLEIVSNFEKIANHMLNILQALRRRD